MSSSNPPLLSLLVLFPLIGSAFALGPWFSKSRDGEGNHVRIWAVMVSLMNLLFLLAVSRLVVSEPTSGGQAIAFRLDETYQWIPSLGIALKFTLDGISFAFCCLTALISLVVVSWSARPAGSGRGYYALLLAAQGGVMGAFLATDLVLFYVFYELMLLPVIACVAIWGGARRLQASLKFLVYTVAGSVLMLVAILYIGWRGRAAGGAAFTFDVHSLAQLSLLDAREQIVLGLAFMLAFAVKIPMVPFHSWLPDTYREAPHAVAAFIAALLGKVGIYGVIRFMWPLFPEFMGACGYLFAVLGAFSVVYGALVAMCQKDIRSLLAYSSISHLGFCVLALGTASQTALSGAVFQSFSHGIVTAALFLMFGTLIDRQESRAFENFGGLASSLPRSAFLLMIFTVAAVALPLTSGFVGEFLIVMGAFATYPFCTSVALLGVVFGAVYMLTAYMDIMFGQSKGAPSSGSRRDIGGADACILGALGVLMIVLGIWPAPLLDVVAPSLQPGSPPGVILQSATPAGEISMNIPVGR